MGWKGGGPGGWGTGGGGWGGLYESFLLMKRTKTNNERIFTSQQQAMSEMLRLRARQRDDSPVLVFITRSRTECKSVTRLTDYGGKGQKTTI